MNSAFADTNGENSRHRILGLVPHLLVVLGVALMFVDSRLFILAALGIFGPGVLSEFGLVKLDEFKLEARLRAGHQAFLMGGIFLSLVVGFNGCGQRYGADFHEIADAIPASLVLTVMLAVYYLSGLIRFWGPRKAAFRIITFYSSLFLGLFVIAMVLRNGGQASVGWQDILKVLAFFVLNLGAAFIGRKYPWPAIAILIATTAWLGKITGVFWVRNATAVPWELTFDVVVYALLLPVTAVVALLASLREPSETD